MPFKARSTPDVTVTFDAEERPLRAEVDDDADGRVDLVRHYEAGELVREEEDRDGDGKPDVVTTFDGDVALRREADTNGDGKRDTFIDFRGGE